MQPGILKGAAAAAIVAGVLHAVAALPAGTLPLPERSLETLYLIIDVLVILGIAGLMARLGDRAGTIGVAAFVAVVAGISIIRTGTRSPFGAASYADGAALVAIGLALLALPMFRLGAMWRIASLCWLVSLAAGLAGVVPGLGLSAWSKPAALAASLLFSAGMIAAGAALYSTGGGRRRR